jgi:hypothetical protein
MQHSGNDNNENTDSAQQQCTKYDHSLNSTRQTIASCGEGSLAPRAKDLGFWFSLLSGFIS